MVLRPKIRGLCFLYFALYLGLFYGEVDAMEMAGKIGKHKGSAVENFSAGDFEQSWEICYILV